MVRQEVPKVRSGEKLREYRESYNYRREYFKRNPGMFGCIWFCSQCYRPLVGRKSVVVDHIVPLSKGGINHVSNCTAICQKCNRNKSDKIDGRILKGSIFKFFESNVFRTQRGVGAAVGVGAGLTAGAVNGTWRVGRGVLGRTLRFCGKIAGGAVGLVTYPLRKGNLGSRLFFLVIYTLGILFLLSRYTNVLDAWLP